MAFAHLSGIFPRSEELIAASRAFERGRLDADSLRLQAEEEARRLVALQEEWGFDYVTDGLLRWQDLLRPLADELPGVHAGPVTRWFDNNSFYRRPVIEQRLQPVGDAALRWTVREPLAGRPWKAILPTPWAFAALSEDQAYGDSDALLHDAAEVLRAEAAGLAAAGCRYIQFSDPVLVTAPADGAVPRAQRALGRVVEGLAVRTGLYTFFGDAAPVLAALLDAPVDEVGFDLFATDLERLTGRAGAKGLLLGALDGRNSLLEDARETAATVSRVADRLGAEAVSVVPSCDLEFLPYEVAVAKGRRLGEIKRLLR
jgi:5-methyltetrahydropteroyltriglutamate--homocysteine methyltransferase